MWLSLFYYINNNIHIYNIIVYYMNHTTYWKFSICFILSGFILSVYLLNDICFIIITKLVIIVIIYFLINTVFVNNYGLGIHLLCFLLSNLAESLFLVYCLSLLLTFLYIILLLNSHLYNILYSQFLNHSSNYLSFLFIVVYEFFN